MRPGPAHARTGFDSEMTTGLVFRLGFGDGQTQAIERLEEISSLAHGPGPDAPHPRTGNF